MLVRWEPIRELDRVTDELNSFFDGVLTRAPYTPAREAFFPSADIVETDDKVVVSLDVPGINKDEIEISVENGVLSVKGERKFSELKESERYVHLERSQGAFNRTFRLSGEMDVDKVDAKYDNGVLLIEIQRSEQAKPRRIEIKT
jgi:HSP20 family protein